MSVGVSFSGRGHPSLPWLGYWCLLLVLALFEILYLKAFTLPVMVRMLLEVLILVGVYCHGANIAMFRRYVWKWLTVLLAILLTFTLAICLAIIRYSGPELSEVVVLIMASIVLIPAQYGLICYSFVRTDLWAQDRLSLV